MASSSLTPLGGNLNMELYPSSSDSADLSQKATLLQKHLNPELNNLISKEIAKALISDEDLRTIKIQGFLSGVNSLSAAKALQKKFFVKQLLDERQRTVLSAIYSEFNLDFSHGTDSSDHYMARACRDLDREFLYRSLGVDPAHVRPVGDYDVALKDIGGNPLTHLNGGHASVHSCFPVLSHDDDYRHSVFLQNLRDYRYKRVNAHKLKLYNTFLRNDRKVICMNRAENCTVRAQKLMGLHSAYDMTMREICLAMDSADALEYSGCIHFSPEIFISDEGRLPIVGAYFRKFKRGRDLFIRFFFENDPQNGYEHRYSTYIQKFGVFRQMIVGRDGHESYYICNGIALKGDTYFFKVVKSVSGCVPSSRVFRALSVPSLREKVIVYYWRYETLRKDYHIDGHMIPYRLVVPNHLFQKLYAYAMGLPEGKFTIKNLLIAGNTFNTREVVSGVGIKTHEPMDVIDLQHFCHALFILVYIGTYECSKAYAKVKESEDAVRGGSFCFFNWFRRIYRSVHITPQMQVNRAVVKGEESGQNCKFFRWLQELFEVNRNYEIVVDRLPSFVTIEDELNAIVKPVEYHNRGVEHPETSDLIPYRTIVDSSCYTEPDDELVKYNMSSFEPVGCHSKTKRIDNSSEGYCVYQSLVDAGVDSSVDVVMSRLRDSRFLENVTKEKDLREVLNKDGRYPNEEILIVVALEYERNICKHELEQQLVFSVPKAVATVHLEIIGNHCQALLLSEELPEIVFLPVGEEPVVEYSSSKAVEERKKIFDRMRITKTKAGILNRREYENALNFGRVVADPYSFLGNGGYICRSGLKTAEILARENLGEICYALSLGGPGGEVQVLLERTPAFVFGITKTDMINFSDQIPTERFMQLYGSTFDGDITSLDNIYSMRREIFSVADHRGVDFVGGDLSVVVGDSEPDLREHAKLLAHSVLMAICVLAHGGFAYFKVFSVLDEALPVVSLLREMFAEVEAVKLLTSRPHSSEYHLLCRRFNAEVYRPKRVEIANRLVDGLLTPLEGDESSNACFIQQCMDKYTMGSLDRVMKLFNTYQKGIRVENQTIPPSQRASAESVLRCLRPYERIGGLVSLFKKKVLRFLIHPGNFEKLDEFDRFEVERKPPVVEEVIEVVPEPVASCSGLNQEVGEELVEVVSGTEVMEPPDYERHIAGFDVCDDLFCALEAVDEPEVDQTSVVCLASEETVTNTPILFGEVVSSIVPSLPLCGFRAARAGVRDYRKDRIKNMYNKPPYVFLESFGISQVSIPPDVVIPNDTFLVEKVEGDSRVVTGAASVRPTAPPPLGSDRYDDFRAAVREYTDYLRITVQSEVANAVNFCNRANMVPNKISFLHSIPGNYGMYRNGQWVHKPKVIASAYIKAVDVVAGRIVDFPKSDVKDGILYMVSDYCIKGLDIDILRTLDSLNFDGMEFPEDISMIQAVPGSGKTRHIITANLPSEIGNVILSTTEGQKDFVRRYQLAHGDHPVKARFRTMASYLINSGTIPSSKTLYIDEALMYHPGAIFSAIALTPGVTRVLMLGDAKQIPFVNRTPEFVCEYKHISSMVSISTVKDLSYRCPVDVAYRLHPAYEEFNSGVGHPGFGMDSCVEVYNSCKVVQIQSLANVRKDDRIQYLTFTQSEKEELSHSGFKRVSTVHEFQGKESDVIAVVRTNRIAGAEIYLREEYALVALTRHTKELTYFTAFVGDSLTKLIRVGLNGVEQIASISELKVRLSRRIGGLQPYVRVLEPRVMLDYRTFKSSALPLTEAKTWVMEFVPRAGNYRSQKLHKSRWFRWFDVDWDRRVVFVVVGDHCFDKPSIPVLRDSLIRLSQEELSFERYGIDSWLFEFITPTILSQNLYKHFGKRTVVSHGVDRNRTFIEPEVFSLVNSNAKSDFVPNELVEYEVELFDDMEPIVSDTGACVSFEMVQGLIDDRFGVNAYIDQSLDSYMVETSDLELGITDFSYTRIVAPMKHRVYDSMTPVIRTPLPILRDYTYRESLIAFQKRNGGVPQMVGSVDVERVSDAMVDAVFDRCFDSGWEMVCSDQIAVTSTAIHEWLKTQKSFVVDHISPDLGMHQTPLNSYLYSIKRNAKPDLTQDAGMTYSALQTIVYHEKHINAYFCAIFRECKRRILMCLRPNIKFFCDVSNEEFVRRCQRDIGVGDDATYAFVSGDDSFISNSLGTLELDISKFDKSQWYLDLVYEVKWMHRLGVSVEDCQLWFNAHYYTRLYDMKTRFTAEVNYQRKSGDASTYIGNTMKTLGSLAYFIPFDDFSVFDLQSVDFVERFPLMFNLEIKKFEFDSPYFCSKFFGVMDGRWWMVPDPVKLVTKLGRSDLVNEKHVEEYRRSFVDLVKPFSDRTVCELVADAVVERYNLVGDYTDLFHSFPDLARRENFCALFFRRPGDVIDENRFEFHSFD